MRSFFTRAFYLLQELAGLDILTSLDVRSKPPHAVVRHYIPSPSGQTKQATGSVVVLARLDISMSARFFEIADVTERAEL